MTTSIAPVNGIEIAYETHGDPTGEPLLLVMGLGAQLIAWPLELCDALVDRGFFVARYDNRDVGLSTKFADAGGDFITSFLKASQGEPIEVAYKLSDMAADGMALLDHLGIESAHVVGASMGGMIAQTMAIEHPQRVLSLTSIMSTTGRRSVGWQHPRLFPMLLART
ncbi:MAG: alpha/beta fold hydrolase, partial [Acidimicrobiales bacterium]